MKLIREEREFLMNGKGREMRERVHLKHTQETLF